MPRQKGNGEGTFDKTESGLWRLRKHVENPLTHIKERKTFTGKTKPECSRKCRDYEEGRTVVKSSMNVEQLGAFWLTTFVQPKVQAVTFETYQFEVKKIYDSFLGKMAISDVKPLHIQKFFNENASRAKSSLKKCRYYLNGMFECAVDNDLIFKNPCRKIAIPKDAGQKEKQAFTDDEIAVVTDFAMQDIPFGQAILIMLYAGLRKGELRNLKGNSLDIKNNVVLVRGAMDRNSREVLASNNKNHNRDVPLPSFLSGVLIAAHETSYLLTDTDAPMSEGAFRIAYNAFFKRLDTFCELNEKTPIRHLSPHELRHTYSTICYRKNIDLITVKDLLGHKSINMTDHYTHDDFLTRQKAVNEAFENTVGHDQ